MVYTDKIHLVADTLEELHEFASNIGMKSEWFQDHPSHPHYDIWGIILKKALDKGIQIEDSKKILEIAKKAREKEKIIKKSPKQVIIIQETDIINYSNKTFITKLFLYLTNLFSFKELETKSLVFKCSLLTKTDILRESKFDYSCYLIYREGFYYLIFHKGFEIKIMEEDCNESK